MYRRLMRLVLLLGLTLLVGCAGRQTVVMDSSFRAGKTVPGTDADCTISVAKVFDLRKDKDSMGTLALTDVSSADVIGWLSNGLTEHGFSFAPVDAAEELAPDINAPVDIGLIMAYIRSSSTSKASNVVISVTSGANVQYFRGDHAGMNWNNSSSGIKGSFDHSLNEVLVKIKDSLCD